MPSYLSYCHVLSLFLFLCRHSSCSLLIHSFASLKSQSFHWTFLHSVVLSYNDQYETLRAFTHILTSPWRWCLYTHHIQSHGPLLLHPFPSQALPLLPFVLQFHWPALFSLLFSWSSSISISLQEGHHLIISPRCHSGTSLEGQPSCWDSWMTHHPKYTRRFSVYSVIMNGYEFWLDLLVLSVIRLFQEQSGRQQRNSSWWWAVAGWYLGGIIRSLWGFSLESGSTLLPGKDADLFNSVLMELGNGDSRFSFSVGLIAWRNLSDETQWQWTESNYLLYAPSSQLFPLHRPSISDSMFTNSWFLDVLYGLNIFHN